MGKIDPSLDMKQFVGLIQPLLRIENREIEQLFMKMDGWLTFESVVYLIFLVADRIRQLTLMDLYHGTTLLLTSWK